MTPEAPAAGGAPLYRLVSWLSPAFPVGAFSYSHGLEWAVEADAVRDRATAESWIGDVLANGAGRTDAIFLRHADAAVAGGDQAALAAVNALAVAFAPSAERHLETTAQGRAFLSTVAATWPHPAIDRAVAALEGEPVAYPVAVGIAAGAHGIAPHATTVAYLHAFAANLVSAAVRLVPLGQTDGQRITAALAGTVEALAAEAAEAPLEEAGGAAIAADVAAMRHETQYTRLFRS